MEKKSALVFVVLFSILGNLFSGYLTFTKLLLGYCPLKEPCPQFFGLPACVYGLVMYLILLVVSIILLATKGYDDGTAGKGKNLVDTLFTVSFIGIIFAIYSTIEEIYYSSCPGGCSYSLLIPTCVYGLVMFSVVLAFTTVLMKKGKD